MKRFFTLGVIVLFATMVRGEEQIVMGFYDVGLLYDTIPSNFYNDKKYTPKGRNRWNSARYERKVERVVGVIDSMKMPIIALLGVENEAVVRDIVNRSAQDYSYVHRTINYYDGLDFALLYYGDLLFVERVNTTKQAIVIRGEIEGQSITFHLSRAGARLRTTMPTDDVEPSQIDVVWGRFSREDLSRLRMDDPLREAELIGHGDTKGELSWIFKNRLGVSLVDGMEAEAGVYIAEWLLTSDRGAPLPTFSKDRYYGGYSNHLPLYLIIKR